MKLTFLTNNNVGRGWVSEVHPFRFEFSKQDLGLLSPSLLYLRGNEPWAGAFDILYLNHKYVLARNFDGNLFIECKLESLQRKYLRILLKFIGEYNRKRKIWRTLLDIFDIKQRIAFMKQMLVLEDL